MSLTASCGFLGFLCVHHESHPFLLVRERSSFIPTPSPAREQPSEAPVSGCFHWRFRLNLDPDWATLSRQPGRGTFCRQHGRMRPRSRSLVTRVFLECVDQTVRHPHTATCLATGGNPAACQALRLAVHKPIWEVTAAPPSK